MRRIVSVGLLTALTGAVIALPSSRLGNHDGRAGAAETMPDVQIVQPLSNVQRQRILKSHQVTISKRWIVTVFEPRGIQEQFVGRPITASNAPRHAFSKSAVTLPKLPSYYPYPCKVHNPRTNTDTWGVCFTCKF